MAGHRAARRRRPRPGRQGHGRGIRRNPRQPQAPAAEPAHHDPGRQGRPDRHGLLARPHGGRRSRTSRRTCRRRSSRSRTRASTSTARSTSRACCARSTGTRRAAASPQGASTLTQQYVKNVFVEEAGDDPTKVAAGHPADHRPQDQGTEVRDPGRGGARQEEDPRELPQHHLLRPAGLRHRGRRPALLLQVRQGPDARGGRAAGRHRPVAEPLRPGQRRGRRPPSAATPCCSAWPTSATSPRRRPTRPRRSRSA